MKKRALKYLLVSILCLPVLGIKAQSDTSAKLLKIDLPAALMGNLSLAYEHQYDKHSSWEISLLVFTPMAAKWINANDINGFMVRLGQKTHPQTKYMIKRGIENQNLEGFYVRREVFLIQRNTSYNQTSSNYYSLQTSTTDPKVYNFNEMAFGAMYNLGIQKRLGRKMKFDTYFGMGLGYSLGQNNLESILTNSYYVYNPNFFNTFGTIISLNGLTTFFQAGLRIAYEL